jgi:hypothetical protein
MQPPSQPLLGGVVLTTPATIALAVAAGDLRSLDAIVGALSASDPLLRAMAIAALGLAGDSRVLEAARAALADTDPRVRLAAADALVRLGMPDAAHAVEALVANDATALGALHLAELVQGEGVTKAAAARAVASSDPELRAAAVAALGRQRGPLAVGALATLLADPLEARRGSPRVRTSSGARPAEVEASRSKRSFRASSPPRTRATARSPSKPPSPREAVPSQTLCTTLTRACGEPRRRGRPASGARTRGTLCSGG